MTFYGQLVAKSGLHANPKDTTDWPEGVWTQPPTLRLGDEDEDQDLAVGESVPGPLRFEKPKAGAPAPKAKAKK